MFIASKYEEVSPPEVPQNQLYVQDYPEITRTFEITSTLPRNHTDVPVRRVRLSGVPFLPPSCLPFSELVGAIPKRHDLKAFTELTRSIFISFMIQLSSYFRV